MNKHTKSKIALVVPDIIKSGGGVGTLTEFLYRVISNSGVYDVDIISLATSSQDKNSVRLLVPNTWLRPIQVTEILWHDKTVQHVGTFFAEFEFQRYRPRPILSKMLNNYDLIQFAAGGSAMAFVAHNIKRPICLQVATSVQEERKSIIRQTTGWKQLVQLVMLKVVTRIEHQALRKMAYVFAISHYTEQILKTSVSADRLIFGPPGIDTEVFHPTFNGAKDCILSVGRFADPRKNVPLLFHAYYMLCQIQPNTPKLVLAGSTGPTVKDWELADSLKIRQNVEFRPNLSILQLADLYRNAALFVLSSNEEGLGIVVLEAMASGLAVVATRCGGTESTVVVGVTGYLTPTGDAQALATQMNVLIEDKDLCRTMGQAGRQHVEQFFSMAVTGKVFLDKYAELLGKPV